MKSTAASRACSARRAGHALLAADQTKIYSILTLQSVPKKVEYLSRSSATLSQNNIAQILITVQVGKDVKQPDNYKSYNSCTYTKHYFAS